MANKHRKLSSLSNLKGANLCLKCTEILLAAGLPRTAEGVMRCPWPQWEPIAKERKGRAGAYFYGGRGEGTERGKRILPEST